MSARIPVLFDATSLPPNWGGVARYIQGLLAGLDELGVSLQVVAKPADIRRLREAAPGHDYHAAPGSISARPLRFAWEQVGLPRLAQRLGVVAIHSPHYTLPLTGRTAAIVTVHDATFFTDPEVHSRLKRTFFTWWTRRAARRAAALVTPSRATAEAMQSSVGAATVRGELVVAYLGVDGEVFHRPDAAAVTAFAASAGLDVERGWIAFLGTIEPRKNVPALLRAHAALRASASAPGTVPPLVLSGARGWDEEAARLLDGLTPADGVIEAGYLPLESLPAFLGGARVLCYPSLGEGFGLPVLEAMACGAAVLTTRRLSIPEVGGDAVAYTEPDDAAIAEGLRALLADPDRRAGLAEAAVARSAGFTWAACAEAHLTAYAAAGAVVLP